MSSETPPEPERSSSDAFTEARPRRAHTGEPTPGSPSTPVRFPARADDSTAGEDDAPTRTWTWQAPADEGTGPDAPQPADQSAAADRDPEHADRPVGRRVQEESAPGDQHVQQQGADRTITEQKAPATSEQATSDDAASEKAASEKAAPEKAPAKKPAKKAAAGKGKGGPAGKGGQAAKGKGGKGRPGQGRGGQRKPGGGQLPTRRKQFRVLQGMGPMERRPEIPDQSHLPPEQRTDLAIKVNNLSITYRTSFEKKPTLRQALLRFGRGQRAVREVEALQDVSFEVRTGTAMGIIGANGAGKSTLMRAMAGILPPTKGSVEVWGRASTLLALGVGFNNSLSGRENIILGGLAAGLSRDQVEERANEIADWTELGDFIDMPMRTYSSGMFSRVAFSVAVHMEPDILMIDEALSTGDAHFKEKASAKMAELRSKARAMFLVSHGLGTIKDLCDEAIWIDKGHLMERGEPNEVVEHYLEHLKAKRSSATMDDF